MPRNEVEIPPASADLRSAFADACVWSSVAERERVEREIADREAQLEKLASELRLVSRELDRSRRLSVAISDVAATQREHFERAFDDLIALPGVRGIDVESELISVYTQPIHIRHDGTLYRIGEFAIDVDLLNGLRIRNLANTATTTGWDHPHIQGNLPCLGNLREAAEILIGQRELVPLVSIVLQFLETYDPATAYGPVTLWSEETSIAD